MPWSSMVSSGVYLSSKPQRAWHERSSECEDAIEESATMVRICANMRPRTVAASVADAFPDKIPGEPPSCRWQEDD